MKDIQHSKQESYKRKILPVIYMVLVITVMVFAAEISGEKEIIFPEVAAIACGAFIAPKMPWVTNYIRMFICIAICAVLGVLIVMFLPVPLWAQLIVAYAVFL